MRTLTLFLPFFMMLVSFNWGFSQVYTVNSIPNPKTANNTYVSDPDGILDATYVDRLNQICREIEDSTTAEVAVVIVQSIGEENPKNFATELFNYWGIGKAATNNGLLVFTVMDARRTEFETGYGMEAVLPDVVCYRIGMQELVPYFRQGQYGQGLEEALLQIQFILQNPEFQSDLQEELRSYGPIPWYRHIPVPLLIYGFITLLWALIVELWTLAHLVSKQDQHDKYMNIRKLHWAGWAFLFPVLFIPIYFLNRLLLKRLRNQGRFSRENGKEMHKLSEAEDDELLEAGQVIEEQIGSVDYDVWVTRDMDDMLVLPYKKRWTKYKSCPECGYKTYHLARTAVLKKATTKRSGKGVRIYKCKNCHYTKEEEYTIAKKSSSSSGGYVGGSFSSGGGFSGGGSFGGGSSGGGGGGVSW